MVSALDGQQRSAPLRHGVNEGCELRVRGVLCCSSRRALSSSWRVCGGEVGGQATCLPRASQTYSIYIHVWGNTLAISIQTISFSTVKSSTRSGRPPYGDAITTPPLPHRQQIPDTLVHPDAGLFLLATVPPDENTPIIRMNRKAGLVRKRTLLHSFHPSSSHALLLTPCGRDDAFDVSLTHTIERGEHEALDRIQLETGFGQSELKPWFQLASEGVAGGKDVASRISVSPSR
ncbi:hypothetical protein TNCV_2062241 [Trichonephila clavipes]|nr:hypothetical protein TNCV_2062241 [Trichonephila clavipes]